MLHIPYKSNIEATQAVLTNQVDITFDIALSSVNLINANKLRALGITNSKRLAILETVPTIAEAGLNGYVINAWYGLAAPLVLTMNLLKNFISLYKKFLTKRNQNKI
jgi:tripartite-type tricarboxylate transporter receptor subunit TctC